MTSVASRLKRKAFALTACAASMACAAPPSMVPELNRLLGQGGHRVVDRMLEAQYDSTWRQFLALETSCDRPALVLGLKLLNTTNATMLEGYYYGLQVAMGRCPDVLLPLAPASRVGELCNIAALTEFSDDEGRTELQRRLAALQALPVSKSPNGLACVREYQHEVQRASLPAN